MRVITGTAGRKNLLTLQGDDVVRPTSGKIKEAVFSAIQFDIEGRRFLDLFAGCGQMGIEALSRGAESAVFTDTSAQAISVIKKNLDATGLTGQATVLRTEYASFLSSYNGEFDIAYIDPPYRAGFYDNALEKVTRVMSEAGLIICEHPTDIELRERYGDFILTKNYRYGKIAVSMYRLG